MRSICLYFQVHQPFRLRTYRFFNIGDDHQYYDEYQNRQIVKRVAEKCYLPANRMILELIREYGSAFKISFSISGTALDQFQLYSTEVIQSFRQLADTGCVEFLAETYAHSLASLGNKDEFFRQVDHHRKTIEHLFGKIPVTFRNSELIYSDKIGDMVTELGFNTMITEGAKHILGWKSPNFMYCNAINPKLKLFLRNFRLSDDIAFRFSERSWSEWPLTTEKFVGWLNKIETNEEVVNIFIDYETLGERQPKETGIFDFFRSLPRSVFANSNFSFSTPCELTNILQPMAAIHVPHAISWADEERDLTSWKGNELQDEAFLKLYSIAERIRVCKDPDLLRDWQYLQTSDHFYYMCTKWFSDGAIHKYFNPYPSPYEAFINYMNVLSDFTIRVDECLSKPAEIEKPDIPDKAKGVTKKETAKVLKTGKSPVRRTGKLKTEKTIVNVRKLKDTTGKPEKSKTGKEKSGIGVKNQEYKAMDFEDIIHLSDNRIRQLVRKLDIKSVSYALKGADKKVRQKVEKNLGKRALEELKSILKELKGVRASEVKKYRKLILDQLNIKQK